MPLLLPVSASEYETEDGMYNTSYELNEYLKELGYNIRFRVRLSKSKNRFNAFVREGNDPRLKVAQELYPEEMVHFLNSWWSGFRYCHMHLRKIGHFPKELPIILPDMRKKREVVKCEL